MQADALSELRSILQCGNQKWYSAIRKVLSHSSEEKQALAAYRAEVSKALRWIGGVDYAARLLLLAYIGYILSKVRGMSI